MPQNPKYIEEKYLEFIQKFSKLLKDKGVTLEERHSILNHFEFSIKEALEYGYTQGYEKGVEHTNTDHHWD